LGVGGVEKKNRKKGKANETQKIKRNAQDKKINNIRTVGR
jgi:hypothetical protein